jgi:Flp pilus assembly protein TadG
MSRAILLRSNRSGSAAVEMALCMPLLLALMFGSAEAGNYFMNEHSLIKAVRDGARFAGRRPFSDYTGCTTVSSTLVTDTQNVVMNGYLSTGSIITPNISTSNVTVNTNCFQNAGGQPMKGIYIKRGAVCGVAADNGCAQIVTVSATVPYRSILRSLGFSGIGMNLNASSQAAVGGI